MQTYKLLYLFSFVIHMKESSFISEVYYNSC